MRTKESFEDFINICTEIELYFFINECGGFYLENES